MNVYLVHPVELSLPSELGGTARDAVHGRGEGGNLPVAVLLSRVFKVAFSVVAILLLR